MCHPIDLKWEKPKWLAVYVVTVNVNVKNWVWSKSVGSGGRGTREELCEKVTGDWGAEWCS